MTNSLCTKNEKCTEAQKEAVKHFKGPLLIVAGPGAGKTRVLVERVVYLIKRKEINPENILVITFTVKAAEQLKNRLLKCIGSAAENMQISTIHSFCHEILKDYSDYHDLGATFDVLDEETQLMFLRTNFYSLGLQKYVRMGNLPEVISFFNKCGENRISPDDLISEIENLYPDKEKYIGISKAYKKYLTLLEENHKIDFPGLQHNVLMLLNNHKEALDDLTNRFKFILVDEYQDTNPIQEEFFELISKPYQNLCVVGDEDQSIYAFRGANPENFMFFEGKYGAKRVTLDKNFRSTSNIITVSDKFMTKHRHYKKVIKPVRDSGNNVQVLKSDDVHEEAKNVVKTIKELKKQGIIPHYGYVALLFRSVKYHAPKIINELKRNNIPYIVRGDGGFLKRVEIQSILYMLSFVDPPEYDNRFNSWNKWWNISMFETEFLNLSKETVDVLNSLDDEFDLSSLLNEKELFEYGINNKEDRKKIIGLNNLKLELNSKNKSILKIFYDLLNISGYLKWLINEGSEESQAKLFNLAKLSSIIHKYEHINKKPKIKDLMWYLYMLPRGMQYDEEIVDNPRSVKILTVHQSKGLEFPVVFVCSVIKNRFPGRNRKTNDIVPIPSKLLLSFTEQGELEDRRLFYVAMTRAQDTLVISTADKINTRRVGYSPFIKEVLATGDIEDCRCINGKCKKRELDISDPIYLSYSSIESYKECPFRYKMIYHYGFQYSPSYMQNYGTITHNCLYKIHQSMKLGREVNEKQIKAIVKRCWIPLHKNQEKDDNQQKSLVKKLINYYKKVKPYYNKIISAEEPFSLVKDGFIINGRTDLIIENPNSELELIDFKAREKAGIEETSVGFQLKMYELALKDKYNIDKLCAYTFKDNKMNYLSKEKDELEKINKELEEICNCLLNEDFEPKENKFCSLCIFKFCC